MDIAKCIFCGLILLICMKFIYVKGGCTGGANRCQWVPWESWDSCSQSCGGGIRSRSRPVCCNTEWSLNTCMHECELSSSGAHETEHCNDVCYNGGSIFRGPSIHYCMCTNIHYGTCCENCKLFLL